MTVRRLCVHVSRTLTDTAVGLFGPSTAENLDRVSQLQVACVPSSRSGRQGSGSLSASAWPRGRKSDASLPLAPLDFQAGATQAMEPRPTRRAAANHACISTGFVSRIQGWVGAAVDIVDPLAREEARPAPVLHPASARKRAGPMASSPSLQSLASPASVTTQTSSSSAVESDGSKSPSSSEPRNGPGDSSRESTSSSDEAPAAAAARPRPRPRSASPPCALHNRVKCSRVLPSDAMAPNLRRVAMAGRTCTQMLERDGGVFGCSLPSGHAGPHQVGLGHATGASETLRPKRGETAAQRQLLQVVLARSPLIASDGF